MTNILWEQVITVIEDKPHKFFVSMKNTEVDTPGFERDIFRIYTFEGTDQSNPKDNIKFKVMATMELVNRYFINNEVELHNFVIKYGLLMIRKTPDKREFLCKEEDYELVNNNQRLEGKELRNEILRFISTTN